MAFILSYYYRRYIWIFYAIAFIMAFTRIYIGVHYPFDCFGGAAIGIILGYIVIQIQKPIEKKLKI
jgi:undecaprenyl-diphosphatase